MRNPEVIKALAALDAEADYDTKLLLAAAVYRALQQAVFVLPRETSTPSGQLASVRTSIESDGRRAVVVYTDFDAAAADGPHLVIPFVELCKQIAPMELAVNINPGDRQGGVVPSYWVRAIAAGDREMPKLPVGTFVELDKPFQIAPLSDVTPALRQRLTDGLVAHVSVSTAYLVRARLEGHSGILVAVCLDSAPSPVPSARVGLAQALYLWALPAVSKGDEIFFLVDPKETLVAELEAFGPPFYRRSS